jgi:peptidyl-lysine (3S)-dioxygenase / protease
VGVLWLYAGLIYVQDPYENLYAVVSGTKTFALRPPCLGHSMHLKRYPVWQECMSQDLGFSSWPTEAPKVRWCPIDYDSISAGGERAAMQRKAFPRYFKHKSISVSVLAGDVLYLPSLWYHYVQQDEGSGEAVIAVNQWWDMRFDARFAHLTFLERMWEACGLMQ